MKLIKIYKNSLFLTTSYLVYLQKISLFQREGFNFNYTLHFMLYIFTCCSVARRVNITCRHIKKDTREKIKQLVSSLHGKHVFDIVIQPSGATETNKLQRW